MNFGVLKDMTIASMKMYFRDFTAIFFSLIFPVLFLIVFGLAFSNDDIKLNMYVFNESKSEQANILEDALYEVPIFQLYEDEATLEVAKDLLSDGDLTFVVHIPDGFGSVGEQGVNGEVTLFINESNTELNSTIESIIGGVLDGFNAEATKQLTGKAPVESYKVLIESAADEDLSTIDYIVPGIIGFSIMSLGIFSVAEGFVTYKSSGALRRLFVTPINPLNFIVAQSITRLIMVVINVITMLVLAQVMFNFQLVGDIFNFTVVSIFGAVLFLGIGFAIAGWAKDSNQAAPVAQLVFFPMMFLGGTFFPRELFPEVVQNIAEYLPLSYLTDGLRLVANEAATVMSLGGELLGMAVWVVISYFVAVRVFRWE